MSDAERPSPWLPVNGPTPSATAPPAEPAASLPMRPPVATTPENPTPLDVLAPPPATPASGVRRTPTLSPYFAPRDAGEAERAAAAAVPTIHPDPAPTAYAMPHLAPDPAEAWAPVRPAGIDPVIAATASASPVSLSKPAQPVITGPSRVPQPIDIDEPEVIRPVHAPPAHEILPTSGSIPKVTASPGFDPHSAHTFEPVATPADPVRLLGEHAVSAASLDAAGAPTPATGIPRPDLAAPLPSFGTDEQFIPRFEPDAPTTPPPAPLTGEQPRVSFTHIAAASAPSAALSGLDALAPVPRSPQGMTAWSEVADELPIHPPGPATAGAVAAVTRDPAQNPVLGTAEAAGPQEPRGFAPVSGTPAYAPDSPGALAVTATPPGPPVIPLDTTDERPGRKRRWLWIALALLGGAAAGVLVYRLFFLPEPIILPAPVVTEAAPAPTIEPVAITDPSEFLAGMPTVISTYVLTSYQVVEVVGDTELPARAAEHLILTYGESTGEAHFTVNAYQFYNEQDAGTAFAAWSEGASETNDVVADGVVVGERALLSAGAETSVVWRNGTSVFVLEGPASDVEQFYSYFGL